MGAFAPVCVSTNGHSVQTLGRKVGLHVARREDFSKQMSGNSGLDGFAGQDDADYHEGNPQYPLEREGGLGHAK